MIAEILKNCPSGTKLYSTIHGEVELVNVYNNRIRCKFYTDINFINISFTSDGRWIENVGECVLFPSKENRDWSKFKIPFKDGDIVAFDNPYRTCLEIFIFKDKKENNTLSTCYLMFDGKELYLEEDMYYVTRLATEEEKEKLFKAIKDNGYKWNSETKTLEKLSESNEDVDDEILMSGIYFDRKYYSDEVELHLDNYEIEVRDGKTYAIFKNQETKNSKPNFKVGDKIKCKSLNIFNPIEITAVTPRMYTFSDGSFQYVEIIDKNYELVPNKFDITTLVPFESKVLVRDCDRHVWEGEIYTRYANKSFNNCNFVTLGGRRWKECIPYEGNEHLLGKTDDCYEYFKIWE